MNHIITIPKDYITRYLYNKLQLEASRMAEKLNTSFSIACDATTMYEFFLVGGDKRDAEKIKYYLIGVLGLPELENM